MNNYKRPVSLACRFELGLTNDLKKKKNNNKNNAQVFGTVLE